MDYYNWQTMVLTTWMIAMRMQFSHLWSVKQTPRYFLWQFYDDQYTVSNYLIMTSEQVFRSNKWRILYCLRWFFTNFYEYSDMKLVSGYWLSIRISGYSDIRWHPYIKHYRYMYLEQFCQTVLFIGVNIELRSTRG